MIQIFLFLLFLLITTTFGFIISRYIFAEKRLFALIPFSIIIGVNAFNLLVNIFAHFLPIQKTPWFVLILLVLFSGIFLVKKGKPKDALGHWMMPALSTRQSRILYTAAVIITLASGVIALKSLALDDLFIGHSPLAVTITEGNFPVVDPSAPAHVLSYHYGPELLSASMELIAGIPVWFGYDFQIFLFSGTLFLLLFVLLYEATLRFKVAIVGAALFLYGMGLQWLYLITRGLPAFWNKYVRGEDVPAFFQFLADVAFPKLNTSYLFIMNNHSFAMGVPLFILVLILYFRSLRAESTKQFLTLSLGASIIFGYMALSLETYWVIAFLSLLTMLVIYLLNKKWRVFGKIFTTVTSPRFLAGTLILVVLGFALALLQGGVLASMLKDSDRDSFVPIQSFKDFTTLNLAPNPAQVDNSHTFVTLLGPTFFMQFGLSIILLIPAMIYFFRKREGKFLHLFIIAFGAFLVPLLFRWPGRPWEMSRFFALAMPLFSLLVGVWLMQMYEISKYKKLIITAVILTGLSGVLSQGLFVISNLDRFGQVGPLVMHPPRPMEIEKPLFAWVATSTTLADYFFPFDQEFIRHTGRYTIGVFPYFTFSEREKEEQAYNAILAECSPQGFKDLNIKYLYVTPAFPIKDYKACVQKLGAKEVYSDIRQDDFRLIYRIE